MNIDEHMYNVVLWMNKHIFEMLNNSVRLDAFIGIVGVLIAIVIFIAETMNSNKIETQKRFILEQTQMKRTTIVSVIILFFCIIKQLLPYVSKSEPIIQALFFITELALNILIVYSIYLTIKLFYISIKLNTNSDYFFEEYNNYVEKRLKAIHKKNLEYSSKQVKNESIEKFVNDNKKYFTFNLNKQKEYVPIKANKSGIFKSYDCRILQTLIDKIEEGNSKKNEFIPKSDPIIILSLKGGEKINRGVIIAYCKDDIKGLDEIIRNSILYDDSFPFQDNEINLILNDLFTMASINKNDSFDSDNRLFNFYDFLYKNNMRAISDLFLEYIGKIYIDFCKNLNTNKEFVKILSELSILAYSNQNYEHYKSLNDYIYYCFKEQLKITNDVRKTTYSFANTVIKYEYYSIRANEDAIYYDVLLSNLLRFLFDLICKKEYEAIKDLFENIIFDNKGYIDDEPDEYDIIKMQFSFGFIYGLIILSNKNIITKNDKQNIKQLINEISNNFVCIYDQIDAIYYFKKYYKKYSNIQDVYHDFNFKFEDIRYRNIWSGINVDDISVIKEFIYLFNIEYSTYERIDNELVLKDCKYFYEKLLETVKSDEKSTLDRLLDIDFNTENIVKLLNELIDKCKENEEEYIKNNVIDNKRTESFRTLIIEEIEKGNELISYLKRNKKYIVSNKKSKKYFGFNQIIGKELFFEEIYGVDNISRDYGHAIISGISKKYVKKLDSISEIIKQDFFEYVKEIDKIENYVIITGPLNWKIFNLNNYKDTKVNIGDKKIDLIRIPKAKDIYLIRKQDMPVLKMLKPDVAEKKDLIKNNIFYQLIDCSTDEKTRNEVQKNTKWLNEKGTEKDQIEYLKGKCVFKLFVSPSIRKIPNTNCYKFFTTEDNK